MPDDGAERPESVTVSGSTGPFANRLIHAPACSNVGPRSWPRSPPSAAARKNLLANKRSWIRTGFGREAALAVSGILDVQIFNLAHWSFAPAFRLGGYR
jgi:hypothetical protein